MPNERSTLREHRRLLEHILCPHCWFRFATTDILSVAKHEDLIGDPIVGPSAYVRFRASRFDVSGVALDARGLPCEGFACPQCHLPVPQVFLIGSPLIFSIIGIPASGKSYYLSAMAWELRRMLPSLFMVSFTDADPMHNVILNEYEKTLFLQNDPDSFVGLRKTEVEGELYDRVRVADQNVLLPRPFLFALRPTGKHPNTKSAQQMTQILCFYDNAGENFHPGQDSAATPATQHLARSKVLLFLYDPTQDPRFRDRCREFSKDPQLSSDRPVARQDTVLTEAAVRIRTYADLPPNQKLGKPLIVMVGKSDVWSNLVESDTESEPYIISNSKNARPATVDLARVENTSRLLRNILLTVSPELVDAAEDACDPVIYVPVSALGGSPKQQAENGPLAVRPKDIAPRWVTVPILYAFAKWSKGLVSGI